MVFPDLQSGNLALQALQQMGEAVAIGPVLMGTRRPVHVLQYGFSAGDVVNLATSFAYCECLVFSLRPLKGFKCFGHDNYL